MRNQFCKSTLALALTVAIASPSFADPFYGVSSSLQDLSTQNDMAALAYFKFALGGKKNRIKERFRTGFSLQMRNTGNTTHSNYTRFDPVHSELNLLDLSMGAKGFSSLQLNGVPLQPSAFQLNADESSNGRLHTGLLIAGGIMVAIAVGAAAAGNGRDNEGSDNGNDSNGNDPN